MRHLGLIYWPCIYRRRRRSEGATGGLVSVGLGEPGRHIGDDKKEILKLFKNQYGLVYIEEEEGTRGGFKQLFTLLRLEEVEVDVENLHSAREYQFQ